MSERPLRPKPLPTPTAITKPFWEATKRHKLVLQRCAACQQYVFYPRPFCPACGSSDLAWTDVSGKGTVYSYTVARRPTSRAFEADVPYVIAIVELDEGPRMLSNVVGCAPEDVRCGMAVVAEYEDASDEITLVKFRPAG
ncbi:MAG: Zn-ribbon domain-containing OB-fold protein [Dehalococcoidia bacterium]